MFKKFERDGKFLGFYFEDSRRLFFFGSRNLDKENLGLNFPEFQFSFLRQVHGRAVVLADPKTSIEADGHFTEKPGLALISQTADCIPILLANANMVCALHAGWRGVSLNIIAAAKKALPFQPDLALIGPHIRCNSFEVSRAVALQIVAATPAEKNASRFLFNHTDSDKLFVDLSSLVQEQLRHTFDGIQIADTGEDTKISPEFHSFRRDREQSGRQLSFVVIKSQKTDSIMT